MGKSRSKKTVLTVSLSVSFAFLVLLGILVTRNAVDKEYEAVTEEPHKHVIRDVTFSAKTPDFVHGWNVMVNGVNSLTAKTGEEFRKLPEKVRNRHTSEENTEESEVCEEKNGTD